MEIKKRYVLPVSELTKTVAELAYSLYPEDAVGERKFYSLQRNNLLNKDGAPLFNVGQKYVLLNNHSHEQVVFEETAQCFGLFVVSTVWTMEAEKVEPVYKRSDLKNLVFTSTMEHNILEYYRYSFNNELRCTLPSRYDPLFVDMELNHHLPFIKFVCSLLPKQTNAHMKTILGLDWVNDDLPNLERNFIAFAGLDAEDRVDFVIEELKKCYAPLLNIIHDSVLKSMEYVDTHELCTLQLSGGNLILNNYGDYRILEWERYVNVKNSPVQTMIEDDLEYLIQFI